MKKILTLAILLSAVANFSTPAAALDRMTEKDIEKFYQEAAEVQLKGKKKTMDFFDKHMSDDVTVKLTTLVKIPGAETQEDVRVFTKPEMMATTESGFDLGDIKTIENKVVAVEISADKKSADVKDTNYTVMVMRTPTQDGVIEMTSETTMFCSDHLIFSKKGDIQIAKSECTAEAKVLPAE